MQFELCIKHNKLWGKVCACDSIALTLILSDMHLAVVHDASFAGEYKSQKGYLGVICVPKGDVWEAALYSSGTVQRFKRSVRSILAFGSRSVYYIASKHMTSWSS
eukprot:894475-Amphidinium_carterae.1